MTSSSSFFTDLLKVEDRSNTVPREVLDTINYNMELLALTLQGKLTGSNIANGSIGDEAMENSDLWNAAYLDLHTFVETTYPADQASLQDQIDGKINTWFYEGVPNLNNAPADDWITDELKNQHLGDLYYDLLTGYVYRFLLDSSVYQWGLIEDEAVTQALALASLAKDVADSKRRVFLVTPEPPYDEGDLWTEGPEGIIKRCINTRESGSYSAEDWEPASNYTDDTTALIALEAAVGAQETADGQIQGFFQDEEPVENIKFLYHAEDLNEVFGSGVTLEGNAGLTTSYKKFGTKSMIFNGGYAYATKDSPWSWGTGVNLTIDLQAYVVDNDNSHYLVGQGFDTSNYWYFGVDANGRLVFKFVKNNVVVAEFRSNNTITYNSFNHVAFVRYGATIFFFINGFSVPYTTIVPLQSLFNVSFSHTYMGGSPLGILDNLAGCIDELRICDVAKWTSSFTAPIEAYTPLNLGFGDIWIDTDKVVPPNTSCIYRYEDVNGGSQSSLAWRESPNNAIGLTYLQAYNAQKIADSKITTFYQGSSTDGIPISKTTGDYWIDTDDENHPYRAQSIGANEIKEGEWVSARDTSAAEALGDFIDAVFTPGVSNLQDQIDGKIETWFQEDDPNIWDEEERLEHNNDRWFKPSTQVLKKYVASTNSWETINDALAISAYIAAATAQDTADGKRRVFTVTPTPPYDTGDLWTEGAEGDLKVCINAKTADGQFDEDDWEPASNIKNRSFSTCPTNGKYKKDDLLIPSEGFTSGGKTFVAGEIYRALVDGDGVTFNAVHWVEASLISVWKKIGTVLIDGGQLAADSVNATQLNGDTAMVNFLNALNITAKYISATGITAGTLTLTANLNIKSSDGNLEINGTQLKYTHADGTESRLGASGLRLYENGLLLPYISTVDAGMIDKFNETEGYWNYTVGNGYKKYFYLKRRGIRWLNQADNVKMLVTQGEELEWYDPSQYRHTGIKGMKYAVGDITNIAADVTVRSNSVSSGSTVSMIFLDLGANDSDGYYAQEYITINGETRKIVQYDGGNQRAYVDNSFSSAPLNGDSYRIHTGPGGVNIQVESWYLAPWYSGQSGGKYYYPLTFGYMLILNN